MLNGDAHKYNQIDKETINTIGSIHELLYILQQKRNIVNRDFTENSEESEEATISNMTTYAINIQNFTIERIKEIIDFSSLDNENSENVKYLLCAMTDEMFLNVKNNSFVRVWEINSMEKKYFFSFVASSTILSQLKKIQRKEIVVNNIVLYILYLILCSSFKLPCTDLELQNIKKIIDNMVKTNINIALHRNTSPFYVESAIDTVRIHKDFVSYGIFGILIGLFVIMFLKCLFWFFIIKVL